MFPEALQGWLVRAATEDVVVRKQAQVYSLEQFVPADRLPITRPEHVLLDSDRARDELSDQPFGLDVKSGLGKEATFRAERIDTQPEDRTVIEVDDLPSEKRELAVELVNEEFVTLRPEAELAEWIRTEVLDAYLRHEGVYYQVSNPPGTDDGFLEGIVYFIIDLTRTSAGEAENPVTIRLPGDRSAVRPFVEAALENREGEVARYATQKLPEDVVRFAENTDFLMTYADLYRVRVE